MLEGSPAGMSSPGQEDDEEEELHESQILEEFD